MTTPSPSVPRRSVAAILPAAGSGSRFGESHNKLLAPIAGTAMWVHSARRLRRHPAVGRIIMPIAVEDERVFQDDYCETIRELGIELILGGEERSDSVSAGIQTIEDDKSIRWIAVHDAARPLVRYEDIDRVIQAAAEKDAAILVTPVTGTLRKQRLPQQHSTRTETLDRRHLFTALTPQVFEVGLLKKAYRNHNGRPATDDAELVERLGHPIELVIGASDNLKITYPHDRLVAEAILQSSLSPESTR